MNATLINAIKGRQILTLHYDGYLRTVEPHAYGESKDGNHLLRGYQTAGGSESGMREGWKIFDLSKARAITVTPNKFTQARSGYARGDKAMARIFAEL